MKMLAILLLTFVLTQSIFAAGGIISGTVHDNETHEPLSGVAIKVMELKRAVTSNDSGYFEIKDVPPGDYQIIFTLLDYEQKVLSVTVKNDRVIRLTVFLEKTPSGHLDDFMILPEKKHKGHHPEPVVGHHKTFEARVSSPHPSGPRSSGLKAGYADDNRQFNYFVKFLKKYKSKVKHFALPIDERLWLTVADAHNRPVLNARIQVFENGKLLDMGRTYADGSFFIYPRVIGLKGNRLHVVIDYNGVHRELDLERNGLRKIRVNLPVPRAQFQQIPLDLLFILDTTGSMGEEIERLKNTLQIINDNLMALVPRPDIRFGLVLYRDRDDDYVTRRISFTADLQKIEDVLKKVRAEGGGDTPEDLQAALKVAMQEMEWRPNAIRLCYVITDAPAHLDYHEDFTYTRAAQMAKQKGIKIFAVGTGGLDITGEYLLRQLAQFTYGKYIFLTYGEKGESEGGHPGSVSHHTGSNFQTDKLEAVIIRFTKEELACQSARPIKTDESYFFATSVKSEKREVTLQKLFTQALNELKDYSTLVIQPHTKVSVMPIACKDSSLKAQAEYFTEQLTLAASKDTTFELVERKDLQYIARELGLELGGFVQPESAAKVGKLLGARLLIIANLFQKDDDYEMFIKLERVSTAEILSVTRVRIAKELGL